MVAVVAWALGRGLYRRVALSSGQLARRWQHRRHPARLPPFSRRVRGRDKLERSIRKADRAARRAEKEKKRSAKAKRRERMEQ